MLLDMASCSVSLMLAITEKKHILQTFAQTVTAVLQLHYHGTAQFLSLGTGTIANDNSHLGCATSDSG